MGAESGPDELAEVVRSLAPHVLAGLLRAGEEFAAAEDALQDALVEALRVWPQHPPRDPHAWLSTVATRRLVDARRSESARRAREEATVAVEQLHGPTEHGDDTLLLLFWCCHPDLSPASQVALTLRAVGGLTTREIANAFFVPEATMAQRISRAKRTLHGRSFHELGDLAVVLRVLSLIYHAGHGRRHDLASEAIRLTRQLTLATPEPEARGLLALMLIQHARLPARIDDAGRLVTLDEQDRSLWDTAEIAEGVSILQATLAEQRPGRYQIQAAIRGASRRRDDLGRDRLAADPRVVRRLGRPQPRPRAGRPRRGPQQGHRGRTRPRRLRRPRRDRTGAAALGDREQWHAVRAYLHELGGEFVAAAEEYAAAAERATELKERDHLVRRAARANASSRSRER